MKADIKQINFIIGAVIIILLLNALVDTDIYDKAYQNGWTDAYTHFVNTAHYMQCESDSWQSEPCQKLIEEKMKP